MTIKSIAQLVIDASPPCESREDLITRAVKTGMAFAYQFAANMVRDSPGANRFGCSGSAYPNWYDSLQAAADEIERMSVLHKAKS